MGRLTSATTDVGTVLKAGGHCAWLRSSPGPTLDHSPLDDLEQVEESAVARAAETAFELLKTFA